MESSVHSSVVCSRTRIGCLSTAYAVRIYVPLGTGISFYSATVWYPCQAKLSKHIRNKISLEDFVTFFYLSAAVAAEANP
jgi:hypothetical protein